MAGIAAAAAGGVLAEDVVFDVENMLPGEFSWHPELSPEGAVAIVVSIPEQRVHVYRNGIRIAVSTCSTGKPGHGTPTGVFTILQKDKNHHSSTYNNAAMPNMNRLTWDGIALHAGNLPGYPASHGCVRLPVEFSEKLFTVTHVGSPVILAGSSSDPWQLVHPGLLLGSVADEEVTDAVAALAAKSHPADWPGPAEYPVTALLMTGADRRAALVEDGVEILEAALEIDGDAPLGEHVFVLQGPDDGGEGLSWFGVTYDAASGEALPDQTGVLGRLHVDKGFADAITARLHPGVSMTISDLAAHPDRRSGTDFVIMTGELLDVPPPPDRPATDQG
jgi:hypothetical protein